MTAGLALWQASNHPSPTIFTDEIEMTQLARSFAATGHATLRGQSIHGLAPLAAYLSAPFWWVNDVPTAYSLIKAFGALIMAAAVFPAYGLARLVVGHRWALFAAAGTGLSPALAYAPILVKEPTAYPAATLALFLITLWLARPTLRGAVLAVAACVLGLVAKDQLAVLFPIFGAAGLALVWRGDAHDRVQQGVDARRLGRDGDTRSRCAPRLRRVHRPSIPILVHRHDLLRGSDARLRPLGCRCPRDRARGRARRGRPRLRRATKGRGRPTGTFALAFVTIVSVVCFGVYTAVKAAYLSTVFANLTLERNLIFLVPLLFAGTALFFERRGGRWWAVVAAGIFVLYLVRTTPYSLTQYPNYEAHGLAMIALANRILRWPADTIEHVLVTVTIVVTPALALVPRMRPRRLAA